MVEQWERKEMGGLGMESEANDFIIYKFLYCRHFLTLCLVFLTPERTV